MYSAKLLRFARVTIDELGCQRRSRVHNRANSAANWECDAEFTSVDKRFHSTPVRDTSRSNCVEQARAMDRKSVRPLSAEQFDTGSTVDQVIMTLANIRESALSDATGATCSQ